MEIDLQTTAFENVLSFSNGRTSPPRSDDYSINVYGSNGIIGKTNRSNSPTETIIIGRVGSYCGSVFFSERECWVTDNAIKANVKGQGNPKYYYYKLKNINLNRLQVGTGQPLLNQSILNSIESTIHSIPEQKSIAHILGALDDKIELNRKMNETLEEMAQALFKSWFVDFDPVLDKASAAGHEIPEPLQANAEKRKALGDKGKALPQEIADLFPDRFVFTEELGWIPEGWEEALLGEYIHIKHGYAFKGKNFSEEPNSNLILSPGNFKIGGGFKADKFKYYNSDFPENYILSFEDIIITMTDLSKAGDTLGYPAWIPLNKEFNYLHNQRLGKVEFKKSGLEKYYLYEYLRTDFYRHVILGNISGTTVKHTSPTKIEKVPIVIAPKNIQEFFNSFYKNNVLKINSLEIEIQSLKKVRDALLPKLISGELRIPKTLNYD